MTSINKIKKAKNSYCACALKTKYDKLKKIYFFEASQRKINKHIDNNE